MCKSITGMAVGLLCDEGKLRLDDRLGDYIKVPRSGIGLLHGELIFEHSGRITVNARGQNGVAIGSGSGGIIRINSGQYRLNIQGDVGLGIGSMYSESNLVIHDCDIGMEMTSARGTAIGSIGRSSDISIQKTSIKLFMSGIDLAGIGSLGGERTKLLLQEASCIITLKGEHCSALAALEGHSDILIRQASVRLTSTGRQALGIGGFTGDTVLRQETADTHITLDTPLNIQEYVEQVQPSFYQGQFILTHNGEDIFLYP